MIVTVRQFMKILEEFILAALAQTNNADHAMDVDETKALEG